MNLAWLAKRNVLQSLHSGTFINFYLGKTGSKEKIKTNINLSEFDQQR